MVAGQTLAPGGPAITVGGTPVSLAVGATQVVVGSRTVVLTPMVTGVGAGATATGVVDLGPAIISGLGGTVVTTGPPGSQYTGPMAVGGVGRVHDGLGIVVGLGLGLFVGWLLFN